ncbi:cell wall-binding repeat-containing protein [Candidatus Poriferisodalis sp.]|uniref:cell wall-binding repeat-containing protein n=1 Tax=Candidatus Poriferisodalis sp. TaxID=3101277 RepID=UPI003C6F7201
MLAAEPVALDAGPVAPSQWPSSHLASPQIEGWPNALRIFGGDRYQTSLASALTTRGTGGFPFDTPDGSSGTTAGLPDAGDWWGLGLCPKAIVIAAGDAQADALAAAALSDPTGQSTEPYLRRVAAADPLFDPPGGFSRVDTYAAPILLTPSARSGATSLALPVRLAAQDLRSGGCNTARQAIIVGGTAAVATEVETELVSIGYTEVFRVSGNSRYGTAAAVAAALGTAAVPDEATGCADPSAADGNAAMAFWANSVVEWRPSETECRLLGRTVVLTDGVSGIDAVAAGWWTSFWQVPVLLHDGSNRLPRETAEALSLLDIEHILVLGGQARLSQEVADEAARLAGAEAIRVGGPNRYATSIEMAKHLGGWWPGDSGTEFESSLLCLVGSSGTGSRARGWPDAFGAGAWCGAASGAVANPGTPRRMLSPVTVRQPPMAGTSTDSADDAAAPRPARDAVPVILVPVGARRLPPSVDQFLSDAFAAPGSCAALVGGGATGNSGDALAYAGALERGSCPMPGFAVAFGGPSVISPELLGAVSSILSGRLTSAEVPAVAFVGAETPDPTGSFGVSSLRGVPLGVGAFATELPMGPVFWEPSGDSTDARERQVCLPRGSYANARWLLAETTSAAPPLAVIELPTTRWYATDSDGEFRSPAVGAPACFSAPVPPGAPLIARAVDTNGRTSRSLLLAADTDRTFSLTGAVQARLPESDGLRSDVRPVTGTTQWIFETEAPGQDVLLDDARSSIVSTRLTLELRHRTSTVTSPEGVPYQRASTFQATWTIKTAEGSVIGSAEGEAVFTGRKWHFRGATLLTGGSLSISVLGAPSPGIGEQRTSLLPRPAGEPVEPLRAGTSDAYGAGGFSATVSVNGNNNTDDTIIWHPEAFINTTKGG